SSTGTNCTRATVQCRPRLSRRSSRVTGFPSTCQHRKATSRARGSVPESEAQRFGKHRAQRYRRLVTILLRCGQSATVPEKMPIAVHPPSLETSKRRVTLGHCQRTIFRTKRRYLDIFVHHRKVDIAIEMLLLLRVITIPNEISRHFHNRETACHLHPQLMIADLSYA